ncbi:MAG TPA: hypothetical protein VKD90_03960, partial [Gemmataceae bacterium]|nr:hypothetical protein [Gemmataceae bacterium]
MPWRVGLDEAGYGPNLGPLVLSSTACHVPDGAPRCLWKLLAAAVRKADHEADGRLLIDDSKKVNEGPTGLAKLEAGVLAVLGAKTAGWTNALDNGDEESLSPLPPLRGEWGRGEGGSGERSGVSRPIKSASGPSRGVRSPESFSPEAGERENGANPPIHNQVHSWPLTLRDYLSTVTLGASVDDLSAEPWYHAADPLPAANPADDLPPIISALATASVSAGVGWGPVRSVVIPAAKFNRLLDEWRRKSGGLATGVIALLNATLDLPG